MTLIRTITSIGKCRSGDCNLAGEFFCKFYMNDIKLMEWKSCKPHGSKVVSRSCIRSMSAFGEYISMYIMPLLLPYVVGDGGFRISRASTIGCLYNLI